MVLKADLKSLFVFMVILVFSASVSSGGYAQEDPNAQYILIQSGELAAQTREIEVPVEVGAQKLQFNLQCASGLDWTIITPSDRPLSLDMPNLVFFNDKAATNENPPFLLDAPRPRVPR